jgi:phage terminase large subunit-like protein
MSAVLDLVRSVIPAEQLTAGTNFDELAEKIAYGLDLKTVTALHEKLQAEDLEEKFGRFDRLFPDDGEFPRHLYPKHLEHFAAGRIYRERCFMAGNRVGKTVAGAYELRCHLTGFYPTWWEGRVFRRPIRAWVAGDTNETTRDILQLELVGEVGWDGNRKIATGSGGMIAPEYLGQPSWKRGVENMIDTIPIKHKSGGWSKLGFKSYDQGRKVFQGTSKEVIWLDEEAPEDVYGECLIRTATVRGIVITTFTPLLGISEVVQSFLPKDYVPSEA